MSKKALISARIAKYLSQRGMEVPTVNGKDEADERVSPAYERKASAPTHKRKSANGKSAGAKLFVKAYNAVTGDRIKFSIGVKDLNGHSFADTIAAIRTTAHMDKASWSMKIRIPVGY